MALKLDELLKKAKDKGYGTNRSVSTPAPSNMIKTWQQESVLYSEKITNRGTEEPNTNRTQTEHKLETNRTQTIDKSDTNQTQQKAEKTQTKHKLDTQPNTSKDTNRTQTEHKMDTNLSLSSLVGLQRKTLIFLFQDCKLRGDRCTQELTIQHVAENLEVPIGSVKTTLARLESKNFIARKFFKNGRGGWSKYELRNEVYRELASSYLEMKLNTNRTQTEHKPNTKVNTQLNTTAPSSSSNNNTIYKNTTTTEEDSFTSTVVGSPALPPEWQEVDIEQLSSIGFTTTHLTQLAKSNKLPPSIVQDSIYAFAFDSEHNGKAKSIKVNPINFFMGILRNGQPYTAPSNYESPSDRAMRLYLEKKRADEQKRGAMEMELWETEFSSWSESLTPMEKDLLLPHDVLNQKLNSPKIAYLRTYHRDNIWPEKKNKIMKMIIE